MFHHQDTNTLVPLYFPERHNFLLEKRKYHLQLKATFFTESMESTPSKSFTTFLLNFKRPYLDM